MKKYIGVLTAESLVNILRFRFYEKKISSHEEKFRDQNICYYLYHVYHSVLRFDLS